jgi:hypothetical protein
MRDEQVRASFSSLGDHSGDRIDREQHAPYDGVRVTHDEADGVPRLSPGRRVELVEGSDDIGHTGHGARLVNVAPLSAPEVPDLSRDGLGR